MPLSDENKTLLDRAQRLEIERDTQWQEAWDDVWRYEAPHRQRKDIVGNEPMFRHINDSTGMTGLASFASFILAGTTPAWMPWAVLSPGPEFKGEEREARLDELKEANEKLFFHFNTSNYYQEAPIAMQDYAIGTGVLVVQPNENGSGIQFKAVPMESMTFDDRSSGQVDYIFDKKKIPAREILAKYGPEGTGSIDSVTDKGYLDLLENKPDDRLSVWVITVPTDDIDPDSKFKHVMITAEGSEGGILLEDKEMDINNYNVFRFDRPHHSQYGVGPGLFAYPDVRYLNAIRGVALKNAALQMAGVFTGVDDGVFDPRTVVLEPGAIIPVLSNDVANPTLSPLPSGSSVELAQFEINTMRGDIDRMFFLDQFSPAQGSKLTATEVLMKAKLIAQRLGTAYGRLQVEYLMPIVKKTVKILQDQGEIDKSINLDFVNTDVVFLSSLAQAQRLQESEALIQWVTLVTEFAGQDMASAMVPNKAKIARKLAELTQIDRDVINSEAEVKKQIETVVEETQNLTGEMQGGLQNAGQESGFQEPDIPGPFG